MSFYIIKDNTINWIANSQEELDLRFNASSEYKEYPCFEIEDDISNYKVLGDKIVKKTDDDLLQEKLELAKAKKLQELAAYDSSTAVNSFTINGIEMWLDKATRTSLTTLANACQKLGQEKMQLQIKEGVFVELPTEQVLQILAMIELYAGQCYIVTQQHNVAISKLETMTEIEAYDFEKGYPKKLIF